MKNKTLAILTITAACWLALFGCAKPDPEEDLISNNSGEPTIMEGIWIGNCQEESFQGFFLQEKVTYMGNTAKSEQFTYSDDQCTQRSSGGDMHIEGTFVLDDGGLLDGKQLTKMTMTFTVISAEGLALLFFPVGSTHTLITKIYIDGDIQYETDDNNELLLTGNGYKYIEPTQIEYDKYLVKQ